MHGFGAHNNKKPSKKSRKLTTARVLALVDSTRETFVSADSSCYGLGAVLLQKQAEGIMKPVAYIS